MAKKIEDVREPETNGRSVRQIQVERDKPRKPFNGHKPPTIMREKKFSKFGIWFGAIIAIIILFFAVSLIFGGATVSVESKSADISVNATFTAFKEPVLDEELSFDVMTVNREVSKEVPAGGEEFVEEKASGTIVIFNNYNTTGQKLIANTRFESPNGLIYRIEGPVTVPGRETINGETFPGSLEVTVFADEAGEAYNIGLTDFTVPGLKGDARFDKIFARSKTEMTGGFAGNLRTASQSDLAEARTELRGNLEREILAEALNVLPEGFILLDEAYDISFTERQENASGEAVNVIQRGTLTAYIFDEAELASFLAENLVSDYDDSEVMISSEENLRLTLDEPSPLDEELRFSLDGGAKIVWSFDETELKEAIKGQSRRRLASVLAQFDSIENAETTIRPFWKRSMPDNPEDIVVEEIVK